MRRSFWIAVDARRLHALDVDRGRALFALLDIKGDSVTFTELVESNVDQRLAVKKQVLLLTFSTDEAEAAIGELLDNTVHRFMEVTD